MLNHFDASDKMKKRGSKFKNENLNYYETSDRKKSHKGVKKMWIIFIFTPLISYLVVSSKRKLNASSVYRRSVPKKKKEWDFSGIFSSQKKHLVLNWLYGVWLLILLLWLDKKEKTCSFHFAVSKFFDAAKLPMDF